MLRPYAMEIYRILIFNEMGIPQSLLVQRFSHSRKCVAVFSDILGVKLYAERNLSQFDSAMLLFSD